MCVQFILFSINIPWPKMNSSLLLVKPTHINGQNRILPTEIPTSFARIVL
jgi:hypothetical protein